MYIPLFCCFPVHCDGARDFPVSLAKGKARDIEPGKYMFLPFGFGFAPQFYDLDIQKIKKVWYECLFLSFGISFSICGFFLNFCIQVTILRDLANQRRVFHIQ